MAHYGHARPQKMANESGWTLGSSASASGSSMYTKTDWLKERGVGIHIGGADAEDEEDIIRETREEEENEDEDERREREAFKRFLNKQTVELLHKLSIRAADGPQKLLRVIKNPVEAHLPIGCRKISTSFHAEKVCTFKELVPEKSEPLAVVVGAFARGKLKLDYAEEEVKLCSYPLSAALTCAKLCHVFEESWNIT